MGSRRAMKFVLPANRAQKAHPTPHRRSSRVVRQVASESAETKWCPGAESNHRHHDFQSCALPSELPGRWAGPEGPLSKARGVIEARIHTLQNAGSARGGLRLEANFGQGTAVQRCRIAATRAPRAT